MLTFMELSMRARGLFALWFTILLLLGCVAVFQLMSQKNYFLAVPAFLTMAFSYALVQWFSEVAICYDKKLTPPHTSVLVDGMSFKWIPGIGILMTALLACCLLYANRYEKNHVTPTSIKEGMDHLPSGLCWYYEDGTVALRNLTMERICREVTGGNLYDGLLLETELRKRMDEQGVFTLPDGTAFSVRLCTVEKEQTILHEICAYDITKEYAMTLSLARKQSEAEQAHEQLTQYGRELAQMIIAGEILAAKVRIHDELGQGLLLTRKYLLRGGTVEDKDKLLQVLRKNNALMESTQSESGKSYFDMIREAASDMGVMLTITGELPKKQALSDILTTAIHENLTNTIRHAHGNAMYITVTEDADLVKATFQNNGDKPKGSIEERGGLAMLRTLVEAAGGRMTIAHEPQYEMVIILKKDM